MAWMRRAAQAALKRFNQAVASWRRLPIAESGRPGSAAAAARTARPARRPRTPRRQLPETTKKSVLWRQRYACASCGCLLPPTYELDHIVPLAAGGTNGLDNLQALCRDCHVQKTRGDMGKIAAAKRRQGKPAQSQPAQPPAAEISVRNRGGVLDGLNEGQLAAVRAPACGAQRVRAGPGTGKTRVLVARVAHLLLHEGVDPRSCLALTFTNKAALAVRAQLRGGGLLAPEQAEQIAAGTFHSVCLRMLRDDMDHLFASGAARRRRGFGVYDEAESRKLVAQIMKEIGVPPAAEVAEEEAPLKPSVVHSLISAAKNEGHDVASFVACAQQQQPPQRQQGDWELIGEVFRHYEELLDARNVVDFDECVRCLSTSPARFLLH